MTLKKPLISLVVCARSGVHFIDSCFASILRQDYDNFEVVCVEGGGSGVAVKKLKEYSKKDKRFRVFTGIDKQPEGTGNKKWFGFKQAKGDIVGIIDLDNVLQRNDLFSKVVSLFSTKKQVTGILAGLKHDRKDSPLVRFVSLFGGDPFFSYRSIDFLRNSQSKVISEETVNYQRVKMDLDNLFLTGGNVFFYEKKTVESAGGYDQDVMTIKRIVEQGKDNLLIIKDATKHYASKNIRTLAKKMMMQKDRSFYEKSENERFNYLPETRKERREFLKNLFFNFLIFPNLIYSFRLYFKKGDVVSFSFPLLAFSTSTSHGLNYLRKNII